MVLCNRPPGTLSYLKIALDLRYSDFWIVQSLCWQVIIGVQNVPKCDVKMILPLITHMS